MKNEKMTPKIRFKGFTDAWEQRKVSEIYKITRGNVLSKNNISQIKIGKYKFPVYSSQTKNNGLLGYYDKFLFENAITWTTDGANAGTANFRNEKFYSTNVNGVLISEKESNYAMANIINRVAFKYVSHVGNPKLMNNVMSSISIITPSINEQIKLSSLIYRIDELITFNERKHEQLLLLKKLLMQKLFNISWRFRGFEIPWEQRKLSELVIRISRKNKDNKIKLPLTISAQEGLVGQEQFFNKKIASKNTSNYIVLNKGEFAYNKSYSKDYPFGAIKRLKKYENGILSSLYICFKAEKVNPEFLEQYYETNIWNKSVSMIATEGARNHGLLNISPLDFFETRLSIPVTDEQKNIGKLLITINRNIDSHRNKINELKQLKKYLMQNMFI